MRLQTLPWWVVAWWALAALGLVPWAVGDPITFTPFRQGVTLDRSLVPPLGWTIAADHRPGWDYGRGSPTSEVRLFTGATAHIVVGEWDQGWPSTLGLSPQGGTVPLPGSRARHEAHPRALVCGPRTRGHLRPVRGLWLRPTCQHRCRSGRLFLTSKTR